MRLSELEIGHDINLTDAQKTVVARIIAAPDANMDGFKKLAFNDEKLMTSKDTLLQIGYIEEDMKTGRFRVTDSGVAAMKEDGVVDENGQLTDHGKDLAYGPSASGAPTTVAPAAQTSTPSNFSQGSGGQGNAAGPVASPSGMNIPFQNENKGTFRDYLDLLDD